MDLKITATLLIAGLTLPACAHTATTASRLGQNTGGGAGCQDISFPIYFKQGSDTLTPVAARAIATAAAAAGRCRIASVRVTGLADASGGAAANLDLSRRRAASVAATLAGDGLPAPAFDVDAQGDKGAVTSDGRAEPMQRRAEVAIHFAP